MDSSVRTFGVDSSLRTFGVDSSFLTFEVNSLTGIWNGSFFSPDRIWNGFLFYGRKFSTESWSSTIRRIRIFFLKNSLPGLGVPPSGKLESHKFGLLFREFGFLFPNVSARIIILFFPRVIMNSEAIGRETIRGIKILPRDSNCPSFMNPNSYFRNKNFFSANLDLLMNSRTRLILISPPHTAKVLGAVGEIDPSTNENLCPPSRILLRGNLNSPRGWGFLHKFRCIELNSFLGFYSQQPAMGVALICSSLCFLSSIIYWLFFHWKRKFDPSFKIYAVGFPFQPSPAPEETPHPMHEELHRRNSGFFCKSKKSSLWMVLPSTREPSIRSGYSPRGPGDFTSDAFQKIRGVHLNLNSSSEFDFFFKEENSPPARALHKRILLGDSKFSIHSTARKIWHIRRY